MSPKIIAKTWDLDTRIEVVSALADVATELDNVDSKLQAIARALHLVAVGLDERPPDDELRRAHKRLNRRLTAVLARYAMLAARGKK